MVGIVVVSHSEGLAGGVVQLAREMGGPGLVIEAAGGIDEAGVLGTDAERVRAAIERVMSPDGVLVLMDLGSALMSAELAVELIGDAAGPVRLSDAPLVEGAVAAAVAASGGGRLEEVAADARGALAMKASQITGDNGAAELVPAPAPVPDSDTERAELPVLAAIGLHARPAARFVQTARRFDADVQVGKVGGAAQVSARSLTGVIALGARLGDTLVVSARGPQALGALEALRELAATGFGDGAATLAPPTAAGLPAATVEPTPPIEPPAAGAVLAGVAASAGVALGPAHHLLAPISAPPDRAAGDPNTELARADQAVDGARAAIIRDRGAIAGRAGRAAAEIFDAHLALLEDEALLDPARAAILGGASAERAWHDAAEQVAAIYKGLSEPLLQERAADVLDVGQRVIAALTGSRTAPVADHPAGGVVIADELTPAGAAGLDPAKVVGIATARGSTTSHAAILARGLGLPAVVGLGADLLVIADGTPVLLDGDAGTITVAPSTETVRGAQARRDRRQRRAAAAREYALEPAVTRDGTRIDVYANIGSARDAELAVALGAEGVGLLRTEFLFADRLELPTEEEQAETLRLIATALDGRPLVVRTLDAGADKPLPALPMPHEANPFLGVRGLRLSLARPEILATQFRAILRVAADHPVATMLPMVATLAEITAARAVLEQARLDTGVLAPMEVGIMVEIPAAALTADLLAEHVDFFSLGTNDLTQYTMAAERGDARLASLLAGPQPAVLRLVYETVQAASARGGWVGVCGELAGDPAAAILLAGLGVTELSMASPLIPEVKAALREVDLGQARAAARDALHDQDAAAAHARARGLLEASEVSRVTANLPDPRA